MTDAGVNQKMETFGYNFTARMMEVLESPKGRLALIELMVCFAAFLLIFLEVFGAFRRCWSNRIFRAILWIAYTLSPYLVVYTLGLMNAAPFKNEHFLIWAAFLIILFGSADSFSAYTLEDNEQWKRNTWQYFIKVVGVVYLTSLYYKTSVSLFTASVFLFLIIYLKVGERLYASFMGTKAALQLFMKLYADYTRREHLKSNEDDEVDLIRMNKYSYLVMRNKPKPQPFFNVLSQFLGIKREVERLDAKAPEYDVPFELEPEDITVERVWQCQGKLLKEGDSDYRIKDLCLSLGLFRILCSRFAGYSMPQKVYLKSWKLFQKIILSQEDGYDRVLRIIEVELSFLFYQFYTKYMPMTEFMTTAWTVKAVKLVLMTVSFILVASTIFHYRKPEDNVQLTTSNGLNIDVLVTAIVIFTAFISENLQLQLRNLSECGKVSWICTYVRDERRQKSKYWLKMIGLFCRANLLKPWERKIHQYSLLESYDYSPPMLLYNNLTKLIKQGQKESTPMVLSMEVKSAVINSLPIEGTKLKNGKTSLIRNDIPEEEYLWACNLETQAHVIMVWHIATSMCEHDFPATANAVLLKNHKIATNLSKYLAYLVAFAPRLLPDHPFVTEYVFQQVIIEARYNFKQCSNLEDRIKALKDNRSGEGGETVIERGSRLGKQLLDVRDPEKVWKVLADFWAELMLYVSPSNDMEAHAMHLSMGGEFITQIWALITHSGIERDPPRTTPEMEGHHSWSESVEDEGCPWYIPSRELVLVRVIK